MKILYIITQADGGGAQKYVLDLAKNFNGTIAAGNEGVKLFYDARKAGVSCIELRCLKRNIHPFYDVLALFEIIKLAREEKPDIIHLNSSKAGFLGSLAKPFVKAKIIFTAHGFIFNEPLPWPAKTFYLALEKFAGFFRNYIICVSQNDKKSALRHRLIAKNKMGAVYNGIPKIEFLPRNSARTALNLPDDKIIIGSVANFYKTKGLDVLISAIALLDDATKSKVLCAIIGEGRERKALEQQISDLGLKDKVKLLGYRSDTPAAIKAFDIFVLASRKEGLPYTLLEAMQAGLPLITTNVGGNPEAVADAAIVIDPEDPAQLARAITEIANSNAAAAALSAKALERSKMFTQTKMLEQTAAVYRQVLKPTA